MSGFHGRRLRCLLAWPDADPGGGDADAIVACRHRRHDLGITQPLSGQWHQAVRCRWLQAVRRDRKRDRTTDRLRRRRRYCRSQTTLAVQNVSRARRNATSSSPSARCRETSVSTVLRIVIDCANGAGYRVAPDALWELGAEVVKSRRRAERPQHKSRVWLDVTCGAHRQGQGSARGYRHCSRWRCRPRGYRRRARRTHRRRSVDGGHR